ncbi:MAG: cobalamin biosynthesis protein P47K, partial [Planctomycetaceae bacterium]
NELGPELSLSSAVETAVANVVVNARVAAAPEVLETLVRDELQAAVQAISGQFEVLSLQCFRPGRPVPTHRLAD